MKDINLICRMGVYCEACRKKDDRTCRLKLQKKCANAPADPDFECPQGLPWGWKKGDPKPVRGLGDVVERLTSAVGIKPCGGCLKRKEKLNRIFPIKKK